MQIRKRKRAVGKFSAGRSDFRRPAGRLLEWVFEHQISSYSILALGLAFMLAFIGISASFAQNRAALVRQVRVMEADETSLTNPAGLAFSARANAFQVVEAPGAAQLAPGVTDVIQVTPFAHEAGSARIAAQVKDPINMAFDNKGNRLLILQFPANILIEVSQDDAGNLDPATLARHDGRGFGLEDPQGMSIDPASGTLFILDASGPRVVRIEPEADGSFDNAAIAVVSLERAGVVDVRGLAFDPATGHLHMASSSGRQLYELTQAGEVVARRDLSGLGFKDPQGMVFAPSGDQTDDPLQMSLYVADSGIVSDAVQGQLSAADGETDARSTEANTARQSSGQIVELSFTALAAPATSSFSSALIRTTDMAAFSPPSPDPSGLAYLTAGNTLVMCDGEVEETVGGITHFQGANVWEMTLSGGVVRTANISKVAPSVVPMTNEPTGVAWNPADGHYFFTDDNAQEVYELDPGTDGQVGTADDTWTSFDTLASGSGDPEGIAFDSWNNRLFVADGNNREIYEFTLSGSLVGHFDVQQYGVADPESVEFNPESGTLFVLSSNSGSPVAVETDTSGALLQTIDISAANATTAAGLAYAPASDGSGALRFYIVDRGIDNDVDANIVDGKMYELTAPAPSTGNTPPVVNAGPDQSIALGDGTILNGSVTDDGLPDPPGAVAVVWSQVSGPGTASFADANALSTTASFSSAGTYVLNLTASDGELSGGDDLNVYVTEGGSAISLEFRVTADDDDAEESATGSMDLGSTDLELVYDRSDKQTVGMRFNGVEVPPGATITNAYIQFQVDETNTVDTFLSIQGEASDHALIFSSSNFDITSRPKTSAAVAWSPNPWLTVGEAGPDQQTPNIAAVVQEITDRPGWVSGNSLVILITGTGERTAESHDGMSSAAPLLHVEYVTGAPVVAITSPARGTTFTEGSPVTFSATASDAEDGDLAASLSWISD
ncbi:MAG: SdiA-regulated domain-containing protein, partial [Anaerolineales bacterium]